MSIMQSQAIIPEWSLEAKREYEKHKKQNKKSRGSSKKPMLT